MLLESIVLAMFEIKYFIYGTGQILLSLITILSFTYINTKGKDNQFQNGQTTGQQEVLLNLFKKERIQNMKTNQNKDNFQENRIQTISQGLQTLHNLDTRDLRQQANIILKNKKNKKNQDYIEKDHFLNNQQLNTIRRSSQHNLSVSMDGSLSQNNFFTSTTQINQKTTAQKQAKTPFFSEKVGIKDNNNNNNHQLLFKDDISIGDIAFKQCNSKMNQSDGNKIQSYLTFNMEKNYANILNTSSIKGSPPLNSQKNINFCTQNNQKFQQVQIPEILQFNIQNKKQKTIKSTPDFPFFLDCDKKLADKANSEKYQMFQKNTYIQEAQQFLIADTYPIISLDKDLNIIHHSDNLIDQLTTQNAYPEENDNQLFNNTQKFIDNKISQLISDSFNVFKSYSNDTQVLEYQITPFLSQKLIESKANQNQQIRNLSNQHKKTVFQKYSSDTNRKQVQELRYLLETTYVQIIEFYESDKKKELIKSFFHHDTIGQKSNFKIVSTTSNIDKSKQTFFDIKKNQSTDNNINLENFMENQQKQSKDEGLKIQNKSTKNPSLNSFSQSPALQGYRKAAIKSLSSNIHFGLNLNSNSTLSNYKYSANELVTNEGLSKNKNQLANQIPKSFINCSKIDFKNQIEIQQTIKNSIQTLNHIPQDLTQDENSNDKSKQNSPQKQQQAQIKPQKQLSNQQAKPSPQTLIIPSFQQLRDPSFTSLKQENLIQQKSQEEFVQNIYQFERPCVMNSLKKIIQNILELEKDNEYTQVTYRIMKGAQIQLIPSCPNCDSIRDQNKKIIKHKQNSTSQKSNIFNQRKLSSNFSCSIKKFNLENISIDIIVNPNKREKQLNASKDYKTHQDSNQYSFQKEKIRLVFRRDFSANFFENVYFVHSLYEEQNRSKAEVLLVKKLFIDSFQSVSHEFGTALNCINNLSEVALNLMNEESGEQLIKPIRYNSAVIQYLINDILDHHMILQNTFVLQIEKFSILKFKEEIIQLFRLQIEYKRLSFDFQIDPQLPEFIYQDKHRIQSILMTMIRNAIKYTQQGGITVEFKIQAVYSDNPTTPRTEKSHNLLQSSYAQKIFLLGIKVKDTGVGLDESESKKLTHLLNYGFCNESISKNSLGNGVGGLCVSNLIAIKLSGRENLGIKFEKNYESSSGTAFRFFVECQSFQKQRIATIKMNPTQFHDTILNHLPTILDNTTLQDNNLADSSHNVLSPSKINSPNDVVAVSKRNSINPFQQMQTSQQATHINHQQQQQVSSANLIKNNVYLASMTFSQGLFTMNQNQQSISSAHYSQIPNSNTTVQPVILQNINNQQSQQVPNSLNSSFNNPNYNLQSLQYFEQQQTEEYQVENLFKNMLFLRAGGGSGSQNQQQLNAEEQDINESLVGTPLTYNQLAGSVSPLQFICGRKSHFTLIPKTPLNRSNQNEINQKIQSGQQKRQSLNSNSQKNFTQQLQATQQYLNNATIQNLSSANSDTNDFQQVFSQRKGMEQSKNQIQEPISLANIKQESTKQEHIEEKSSTSKKIQPSSRLDSLRPKTQLNIKHLENLNSPHFNMDNHFFTNYENKIEEQKVSDEIQNEQIKRQSTVKRQSTSSININTNSFTSRKTRITFGAAQDDQSIFNRDRSQNGSDLPLQNQNSFKNQNNNNFQVLQLSQQVSQEIPIKQVETNAVASKLKENSSQNTQNKNVLKSDFKCDKEIREESDSKIDNSTESCLNKQYSFLEDIADERLENEKPNIVGEFCTFNDKGSSSIKLSSQCCVKVLCVDDEPFNHFVIKQILKAKKINCDTALNGEEGVLKYKQRKKCASCGLNSYSLILMDLNMPIKNGFEATNEIKQYSKQNLMSKVVVITCSAFIDIASKIKAQQSGSDFFISKPISQQLLFNLLQDQFLL